jgi:hypothetical protein
VHSVTLTISPTLWQDEAQTIEHGRAVLNPNSDWGITWNDSTNRPVRPWTYVGPVVQEIAFRAAHESPAGPRIASLLGAILAATAVLLWLLARGTPATVALGLAVACLWDPLFVAAYRGARPDGYALAIPLFAAALAWGGRRRRSRGVRAFITPVVCGAMMTAALFTWATTIILIPFVLVELLYARFGKAPGLKDVL